MEIIHFLRRTKRARPYCLSEGAFVRNTRLQKHNPTLFSSCRGTVEAARLKVITREKSYITPLTRRACISLGVVNFKREPLTWGEMVMTDREGSLYKTNSCRCDHRGKGLCVCVWERSKTLITSLDNQWFLRLCCKNHHHYGKLWHGHSLKLLLFCSMKEKSHTGFFFGCFLQLYSVSY